MHAAAMSDFQLRTPFSRPPRTGLLGGGLRLDPVFLPSRTGWFGESPTGSLLNFGLTLNRLDAPLTPLMNAFTAQMLATPRAAPITVAQRIFAAAPPDAWDSLYEVLRDNGPKLWPEVPSSVPNIVTGDPVSLGSIAPDGRFVPRAPDDVVAGTGLNSSWLGGTISLGRRFTFASSLDVHFQLFVDHEAVSRRADLILGGGGVTVEGRTRGGIPFEFSLGAGRGEEGRPAGFLMLQIGPKYVPQPNHPGVPDRF